MTEKQEKEEELISEGLDESTCLSMLDEAPRLLNAVSFALASPKARENIVFDLAHTGSLSRYLGDLAQVIETTNAMKWTATHWTKSYESAPLGQSSPLEQIELYCGDRQIAVIPLNVFNDMVSDIMLIIKEIKY